MPDIDLSNAPEVDFYVSQLSAASTRRESGLDVGRHSEWCRISSGFKVQREFAGDGGGGGGGGATLRYPKYLKPEEIRRNILLIDWLSGVVIVI